MPNGNSLINVGELTKPATVLIEKISDAVSGLARPFQIRRVGQAEADVEVIKVKAQVESADILQRSAMRFLGEEVKKQANMEQIIEKALPHLAETAEPEKMEDDWISNFFDKSRIISDEEMQMIWARVLAGEANKPGSYSKRTVNFLASLDKADAQLFTKLSSCVCTIGAEPVPLVFNHADLMYHEAGITFDTLTHLDDIGLVRFRPGDGFLTTQLPKQVLAQFHGRIVDVSMNADEDNDLPVGQVLFTNVGRELIAMCATEPIHALVEYAIDAWQKGGVTASVRT